MTKFPIEIPPNVLAGLNDVVPNCVRSWGHYGAEEGFFWQWTDTVLRLVHRASRENTVIAEVPLADLEERERHSECNCSCFLDDE